MATWSFRSSRWHVRIAIIAAIAMLTLILQVFYSKKAFEYTCALEKHTEVQYRFIQQTISPEVQAELERSKHASKFEMSSFISPYHKYYPLNCTSLFRGTYPQKAVIQARLVYQRDVVYNGSFPVPTDNEVRICF